MTKTGLIFILYLLIAGCKTSYQPDAHKSAVTRTAITPTDSLVQKQHKGIDFIAQGNNPVAWTIEADLEKGFTFRAADSRQLIAPTAQAVTGADADIYTTKSDSGLMKLIVHKQHCSEFEKDPKARSTEVTINDKRYTGCGRYLYDPLLNDIWSLETIDNKNPDIPVRQLPWLEFDLEKNKMQAYDGCREVSCSIEVQGNRIRFSPFTGSKTNCGNNETANLFYSMLSDHIVDYYIEGGRLVLILMNETKLVLIKKE